jgi:hypothetical protein
VILTIIPLYHHYQAVVKKLIKMSRASAFTFSPLKVSQNHTVFEEFSTATAKKARKEGKNHRSMYSYSPANRREKVLLPNQIYNRLPHYCLI